MKWVLITGTWKITNSEVERDVRNTVNKIIFDGNCVVFGGATGVDYFALNEALKLNPTANKIRVIIPARSDSYIKDYNDNWTQLPITSKEVSLLEDQLRYLKNISPTSLIEMPNEKITQDHYYNMNTWLAHAEEFYAFQVNESLGTQNMIEKAVAAGAKMIMHKKYTI